MRTRSERDQRPARCIWKLSVSSAVARRSADARGAGSLAQAEPRPQPARESASFTEHDRSSGLGAGGDDRAPGARFMEGAWDNLLSQVRQKTVHRESQVPRNRSADACGAGAVGGGGAASAACAGVRLVHRTRPVIGSGRRLGRPRSPPTTSRCAESRQAPAARTRRALT